MTGLEWFFVILGTLSVLLSVFSRNSDASLRAAGIGFGFGLLALFLGLAHFLPYFGASSR